MMFWSPDASTEAIDVVGKLLRNDKWSTSERGDRLRAEIVRYLTDERPHLRYLALQRIHLAIPDAQERSDALTSRIDLESNTDVLTVALAMLRTLPSGLMDTVLAESRRRGGGPSVAEILNSGESGLHDLKRVWADLHLWGYFSDDAPHCREVVLRWFSHPTSFTNEFGAAASNLRNSLSFSQTPEHRREAFQLARLASRALAAGLASPQVTPEHHKCADELVQELYFASGAYEERGGREGPGTEQLAAWYLDARDVLDDLTAVKHPHTTHELLQVFELLIELDPASVFRAIHRTVEPGSLLQFESMGVAVVLRVLMRYLADYRSLFMETPELLTDLREILETFTKAGWPEAMRHSYDLGAIFR